MTNSDFVLGLHAVQQQLGLVDRDFSRLLGVARTNLVRWRTGDVSMSLKTAHKMLDNLARNIEMPMTFADMCSHNAHWLNAIKRHYEEWKEEQVRCFTPK